MEMSEVIQLQINLLTEFKELKAEVRELRKDINRKELEHKTKELDPYEPQESLKRKLNIGQGLLNEWVAKGLEKQVWSDRNIRYEKEELRAFLKKECAIYGVITMWCIYGILACIAYAGSVDLYRLWKKRKEVRK